MSFVPRIAYPIRSRIGDGEWKLFFCQTPFFAYLPLLAWR